MPLAFGPLSRRPVSILNDLPLLATIAAGVNAAIIYTAEIIPATGAPVYVATEQYATLVSDSRPSIPFNGTFAKPPSFKRSIKTGDGFGGISSGFGPLQINNAGGEYDYLITAPLDGALVVVKVGWRGISYDRFIPIVVGLVDGKPDDDGEILTINIKDDNKRLEIPAQPNVYGGTGGIDGDSNCKGKRKPLCGGTPPNATLQLIDGPNLVYQGHDGQMTGWAHIYDRGVELPVNATADYPSYAALIAPGAVAAGRWASCNALGIVRLGWKPDGVVTGTPSGGAVSNGLVVGSPTVGTPLTDTASILHWFITNSGANIVVDAGSFLTVKAAQPAPIQYFLSADDSRTLRQVIDDLLAGIGGFGGFRADRSFNIGIFTLPTGPVVGDFTEKDWYDSVKSVALPSSYAVPPKRVFAAFSRNFTQQPDVDATVDASTQTLRKDQYSVAVSTDTVTSAAIAAAYPNSTDSEIIPSWFANASDGVAECNRVLVLKGGAARSLFRVDLTEIAFVLSPGMVERLTDTSLTPRYGLGTPKTLTVVEIDNGFDDGIISVEGFC
jgi:hypothetical protein